jgi:hypothetical protein
LTDVAIEQFSFVIVGDPNLRQLLAMRERAIGRRLVLSSATIGILTGLLAFGLMRIGWF